MGQPETFQIGGKFGADRGAPDEPPEFGPPCEDCGASADEPCGDGCPRWGSPASKAHWFGDMGRDLAGPLLKETLEEWRELESVCSCCEGEVVLELGTLPSNGFGSRFIEAILRCKVARCRALWKWTFGLERAWTVKTLLRALQEAGS